MSRDSLPTGVADVAVASIYRARHAVRIDLASALRWCEGPGSLTIPEGGVPRTYTEALLEIGTVPLGGFPTISVSVPNTGNEISEPDASDLVIGATLTVYRVFWDNTGTQLDPVVVFSGRIVGVNYNAATARLDAEQGTGAAPMMVGRVISRLCNHVFRGERCGKTIVLAEPTFTRASVAYGTSGQSVAADVPRFGSIGIVIAGFVCEDGTTNLLTANQASLETDTSGWIVNGTGSVTISRDTSEHWHGAASLKVITGGVAAAEGITCKGQPSFPVVVGTSYSVGVHHKGTAGAYFALVARWSDAGGTTVGGINAVNFYATGDWQWITLPMGAAPAGAALGWIQVRTAVQLATTYYVDAVQAEAKSFATLFQLPGAARAAEALTIPGSAVNASEGTFEASVASLIPILAAHQIIFSLDAADYGNLQVWIDKVTGKAAVLYGASTLNVAALSKVAVVRNVPFHVAVTWGSFGVRIYLDGVLGEPAAGQDWTTVPTLVPGATASIARRASDGLALNGILNRVRILNRALSAVEIANDAALGYGASSSGVTYYLALANSLAHAETFPGCDHSLAQCTAYGNATRFGGWPTIPAVGTKFSYTVVVPATPVARAGSAAPAPPPAPKPMFPRRHLLRAR